MAHIQVLALEPRDNHDPDAINPHLCQIERMSKTQDKPRNRITYKKNTYYAHYPEMLDESWLVHCHEALLKDKTKEKFLIVRR